MINILSNASCSEGYVVDPKGKLLGKILLPELLLVDNKNKPPNKKLFDKYLSIKSDTSVFELLN